MKTKLAISTAILATSVASAALVGTGSDAWSGAPTGYDTAVNQLYSHLNHSDTLYLKPDSNENRFANATTLGQFEVSGLDSLDLFSLGTKAGDENYFGVRLYVGADSYELTLTPSSYTNTAKKHYFSNVNDILVAAGGSALDFAGLNGAVTTETAMLDFFIYDATINNKVYSSGIGNSAFDPSRPVFDFTRDLLENPGPSDAAPLPAGATDAISFLVDDGFEVWGFEDRNKIVDEAGKMEPDYNDRIVAFRIVPVPEPSTYGLIGAAALATLIGYRRFKARDATAADAS